MPTFRPFHGVRPSKEYLQCFPSDSIDELSEEEFCKKAEIENSYAQMIKPYVMSKSKEIGRKFRKVRTNFEALLDKKVLEQDNSAFYLYEQILPDKTIYRGLLGLVSIDDFLDGKIKKHESTITERKEKMAHYLEKVNIQSEPVLLTYPSNPKVELFMNMEEKNIPIINYLSEDDGTRHKIWKVDNRLKMKQIKEVLEQIESFYIADGHHRMGAAAICSKNLRNKKRKKRTGLEGDNFVYAYLVSKESIKIHDYNRLVRDINGLSDEEFLNKLQKSFLIHEKGETPYYPFKKFHFSMYLNGRFYSLHLKHDIREMERRIYQDFDHYLLEKYILKEILDIDNPKTTDRVTYVKGNSNIDSIIELKNQVDSGDFKVAFGIYPVSFNDLVRISDQNIKMPPKCTLIEPKLKRGLIMYDWLGER